MIRLIIIIGFCAFAIPAYCQYDGGKGDGTYDTELGPLRMDGTVASIPYKGGFGDGEDFVAYQGQMGQGFLPIYGGARGDGQDHFVFAGEMGFNNAALLFGGGIGDGQDNAFLSTDLFQTPLSDLYGGGKGDGADNKLIQSIFNQPLSQIFSGGKGDGVDDQQASGQMQESLSELYAGGIGDGADQHGQMMPFPLTICIPGSRLLVDIDASGISNGADWENAYSSFSNAFFNAEECPIDEIWVSKGVYLPTNNNDRNISFLPPQETSIYGGFAGNESDLNQRDWIENETILSGDIGIPIKTEDNSKHVVNLSETEEPVLLDGFIIEKGYAKFSGQTDNIGGGIFYHPNTNNPAHTIRNTTIRNCYSLDAGSGLAIYGTNPKLRLDNVIFESNTSPTRLQISIEYGVKLFIEEEVRVQY